jgi:hypothetical protein
MRATTSELGDVVAELVGVPPSWGSPARFMSMLPNTPFARA